MVRAGLHLMLCCFVTVEGTVGVRYKMSFFSHGAWIFFAPNILELSLELLTCYYTVIFGSPPRLHTIHLWIY